MYRPLLLTQHGCPKSCKSSVTNGKGIIRISGTFWCWWRMWNKLVSSRLSPGLGKVLCCRFFYAGTRFSCLFHQRYRSLFSSAACPFSTVYLSSVALPSSNALTPWEVLILACWAFHLQVKKKIKSLNRFWIWNYSVQWLKSGKLWGRRVGF